MSFRLGEYESLLGTILRTEGRTACTVADAIGRLDGEAPLGDLAILRHDVDRRPSFAVRMSEAEHALGIQSTYYFRCDAAGRFPAHAVERIAGLGHEVGYHYECLSRARGDRARALADFEHNLRTFRQIAPCVTAAMHGAPLSPHRNQELLVGQRLADFGLIGDAVLSLDDVTLAYFTDTGGSWQTAGALNMRDRVGRSPGPHPSPNEGDFARWFAEFPHAVYVSTHPERWGANHLGYAEAALRDGAANQAKKLIALARRAAARTPRDNKG